MPISKISFKNFSLLLLFLFPLFFGAGKIDADKTKERFSLSNFTVYNPGSEVTVNLRSNIQGSSEYNFKLLRINRTAYFFSEMGRELNRYNFDIWGKEGKVLLNYTTPVKEWSAAISGIGGFRNGNNLKIGIIKEPGIYILQGMKDGLVAYCGITVSNYAMVFKKDDKSILAYIVNAESGDFIENTNFYLYKNGRPADSVSSDKDGIAFFNLPKDSSYTNDNVLIIGKTKDETVLSDPYFYFRNYENTFTAYVYTNQPVYRPGQIVHFKAIFRKNDGNNYLNAPGVEFQVKIKSPRNKDVFSDEMKTDDIGAISGKFTLDKDADLGYYNIQLIKDNKYYNGNFSVEEYRKPEYKVEVDPGKDQYAKNDTIRATVKADYYFGSPVTNASVKIKLYRQHYWRPWWFGGRYSWFYQSYAPNIIGYGGNNLIKQEDGEVDKNGEYEFRYKVGNDLDADYTYIIEAEVTDNSRHTVSGSASVYVTRGSFTLSTSPDRYFVRTGESVNLRVSASDFKGEKVQTPFKIIVNYPDVKRDYQNYSKPVPDTLSGKTGKDGKAVLTFLPKGFYSGHYNYTVIAKDKKGRKITAHSSFFMGNVKDYYYSRSSFGLEIVTDKDSYEKGDSLIAYVFLPQENTQLLLTYESNNILSYKRYNVEGNSLTIKEKLTGKFSPGFNLCVTYIKDRQLHRTSKLIGVLDKDKLLNVSIDPDKKTYKPGDEARYKITVKDNGGNPVKNAQLSVGVVDESIYAIKEDNTPGIMKYFYAPKYSYIPTYFSDQNNYYNGSSRYATFIDKNFLKENANPDVKGDAELSGKLKSRNNTVDFKNIYVMLSGGSSFYTAGADSSGHFKFNDILKDTYAVLVHLDDGETLFMDSVKVMGSTVKDIDLKSYINNLPRPVPMGRGRTADMAQPGEALYFTAVNKGEMRETPAFVKPEIRSNFADAAFWNADVVTDKNGTAEVSFKMPDNLTSWRTTVRGITKNTEVGESKDNVITRKNLLVRLETPRFFREGDEIFLSTIVHNYLSENKKVKISFYPEGVKPEGSQISTKGYKNNFNSSDKKEYLINVDKNSEVRIDWKVKVTKPIGDITLRAEALTNEESDAVKLSVPVYPKGFKITYPVNAVLSDSNEVKELSFNIPDNVDLRTAQFSFNMSPSLAGTMLKALDDLAGYPYGCVEQTMSRFLPTLIVDNAFKELHAPLKSKTIEELPKMVKAGLNRLYNFQHNDGGWGWWTNDRTHPFMTAYVIYGMSLAKQAGYKADSSIFNEGLRSLREQLKNSDNDDPSTIAYMLYALSTAEKDGIYKNYKNIIDGLMKKNINPYSLSLLTIALRNMNEPMLAEKMLKKLISKAQKKGSYVYWGGKSWHYSWQDDKVQSTAFAVKALLREGVNNEITADAVRWLVNMKRGFSWRSTQETAAVIFALTDYIKINYELSPDYNAEVYLNGVKLSEKIFTSKNVFNEEKTIDTNEYLKHGKNVIKIMKTGNGRLYFSSLNQYYSSKENTVKTSKYFKIERKYYPLKSEEIDGRIKYEKEKFTGAASSGQIILVKTTVDPSQKGFQYFMLEDMLPSGFEVVKDIGNYNIEGEGNNMGGVRKYVMPLRFYAEREYRDNRVAFFVTNVNGKMEFSYLIRAEMPGNYMVMPAQGSLMYYPEINGSSGMMKIKVK